MRVEEKVKKGMRFVIATTAKTMRRDIDQAWKQAKATNGWPNRRLT